MSVESKESVDLTQVVQRAVNLPSIKASPEKPLHYAYLNDFRVEACPLFKQHQCQQHRPYTCFYWHFANQRRRRPLRRRDGTFNYSPDIYCTKYDENTGICPDGDECMYLHRVAGDVERKYHLRYYKTAACVHQTDGKGHCAKNGQHCAFAHSPDDVRHAVYDIRELQVFTMQEWEALLKRSRRGQEYRVRRMKHTDFKSLKKLAAEIINNRSVDEQGHTVNWMKIKALRFVKGEQTAIYYNYGYDEDSFKRIFVRKGKSTTYVSESNGVPNTNSAVGAQPTIFSADNKDRTSFVVEDPVWQDQEHVLSCYKTEPCRKPARLCRQGYACPYFHNAKDRRRPPAVIKYRSTPCPNAKQSDEWVEAECCDSLDQCQYCHSRTEQQFHPEIYKSTKCNDMLQHGYCPRGPFCAFAHNDNELHAERHLHVPSSDVKDTKRELQDDEKTQKELDRVNTDFGQVDLPEAPMAPASDTLISPSSIANRQSRRTNSSSSDMPIGSAPSYSSPPQLQSVLKHRTTSQSSGPTTVSAPMSMGQGQPSSIMSSSYPRAPGFERHQHSPPRTWTPDQGSGSHPITVTVGGTNRVRTQSLGQQVAAMDLGYTIGSSEALGTSPLSSSFGMRRDLMTCLEDGHSSGDELQLPPISERDESAVLGLCSLISNAVNGGGAAGGKTESGDGNMEFGSIGRLSTTSQRPIGQPMAIPGAQANHQMLQFSESSSGGGLNGSLPTASHLFGAINRAVSAGGGHGSGGSNTHLNMSGSFSNHESPLMPGSEPNQSTIAKMAGELDMNTLVAELQRTNIELNSHRAKVAAWEEGLKQARQACEAWKKEAEAYKTRASAAETERIQLREERDMAVNQVAYLRAELGRLQQEHIRVKDVQLPATFDQLLMQLTHQSQQQQQHQHQQPDVQRTIAGAPPLIPSSMTPSGPMCGRCGRTVGAGKGAGCSFCSNAFNAQAVKNV